MAGIDVMADILHPTQLPKKSEGDWVRIFCEQHLEALNNANLAICYEYPFIKIADEVELQNYIKCRRCSRYCPEEMYANLSHGVGKKIICCICSNDDALIFEHVAAGIKAMAKGIALRKNIYVNRLTSYTCDLCNVTVTNSAKYSHENGKLHNDNIRLKKERDERNANHEAILDQYEAKIEKLESKVDEYEAKIEKLETKVDEYDEKIYTLETELDRTQNEADYFRSKYEQLLRQKK